MARLRAFSSAPGGLLFSNFVEPAGGHARRSFLLETLLDLLAAIPREDLVIPGARARSDDAMGEVMIEVNALSTMLREQRLGAMEATGLLRTIIEEIDLAIFTFD